MDCILVDEEGKLCRTESQPYALAEAQQGSREQNPGDWWDALVTALRTMLTDFKTEDIAAVGVAGEIHGLVALDSSSEVVRDAILWNDARGEQEYNQAILDAGVDSLTDGKHRGHHVESKLLWMREHEPDTYAKIAKFVMPVDYVRYLLTGTLAADPEDAGQSVYFNTEDQQWDNEIISKVGFDIVVFPPVADSNAPAGTVTEEAAEATGLAAGTPVYSAGPETVMRNALLSTLNADAMAVVLGPSAMVAMPSKEIPKTGRDNLQVMSINDGDSYVVYGRQLAGGDALKWAEEAMFGLEDNPELALFSAAEQADPGAGGTMFLPYLMGENSPKPDVQASGTFTGISMLTRPPQLARAVMEGMIYGLREICSAILHENRHLDAKEIVLSGSATSSSMIKHILADVFNLPVKIYQGALEGGAYGAALTAGVGEGMFASFADAEKLHHIAEIIEPDAETAALYEKVMNRYEEFAKGMRGIFARNS
ncbi:MAG: hypothetical protein HDQ87_07980 [Clostridia bacterium]|nr:hypothetical protein [Clostridia bacterium]